MREIVLNKMMSFAGKESYSNDELERMRYGFEALYIFITKSIVVFTIAYFLGILKYTLLFLFFYGIIRSFACGLHSTKSWVCLLFSAVLFLGLPYLCLKINMSIITKLLINAFSLIILYKYAPADTKKRPIINKKKRRFLHNISLTIAITYIVLSFFLESTIICNTLIFALLLESIMILPVSYRILRLPYANYKTYKQ